MTKRLSRYNTIELIKGNIPHLLGKKINLVMKDGCVYFVTLDKFENNIIYYRNMRLKKQHTPIDQVSEIIYDY